MKWARRIPLTASCARQPLDALLTGTLDDRAGERLAVHLDTCDTCQQRLTELAAEPAWWLDASRWLEPVAPDIDPCVDDLDCGDLDEFNASYPNDAAQLLESGLLAKSDNPAMIGSLGRYEVKRIIGSGGTGVVLQAIDTELNRAVAIKVLAPTLAAHGPARKRFARESQAVAAVAHENVVAVHHVEGGGRVPYLVMQYIDGDSLQELVIRNGPLDAMTTLRMTAQLAAALTAAHNQGLVHRDVKPANILVGPAGQRVWMTDFGLARAVDDASLTRTGFIAGTPHYMSPEQARGATVRSGSDLFGLGGVVYFMLTGRPPFRAERTLAILNRICTEPHRPVREVNPIVPPQVAALVDRLLAKSAKDRFSDAEEVRAECLRLLAIQASPDDEPEMVIADDRSPAAPKRRRSTVYQLVGAAVAVLLLAGCLTAMIDLAGELFRPFTNEPSHEFRSSEPLARDNGAIDAREDQIAFSQSDMAPEAFARAVSHSDSVATPPSYAPSFSAPPSTTLNPAFDSSPPIPAVEKRIGASLASEVWSELPPTESKQFNSNAAVRPTFRREEAHHTDNIDRRAAAEVPTYGPNSVATLPASGVHETVVDESVIWQISFDALERALVLFDTDLTIADARRPKLSQAADTFDETLRWMETTADELENQPTIVPPPNATIKPSGPPRLLNNATY